MDHPEGGRSVAQVHRRLYTSDDVSVVALDSYLEGLVEELRTSFASDCHVTAIRLAVEPVSVPTDRAISLGVIVSELVANACKYAYPEPPGGEVRISLVREDGGQVRLSIADDGVGLGDADAPAQGTALGGRIVQAMARAVKAEISQNGGPGGARTDLVFAA